MKVGLRPSYASFPTSQTLITYSMTSYGTGKALNNMTNPELLVNMGF